MSEATIWSRSTYFFTLRILLLDPLTTTKFITELFVKIVIISHYDLLSHSSTVYEYELPFEGSDQEPNVRHAFQY